MYGLMEGLRAGGADARAAQEMEMRRAAEQRALQELAMRQEAHRAHMQTADLQRQQLGLQLKQQQGVDTAMEGLRGLSERDAAQRKQIDSQGIMSFAPQDWADTSERAFNQKALGLMAAKGDAEGMAKLRTRDKVLEANDLAASWATDPTKREKVYDYLDKSHVPLKIERGEWDPKTRRQKTPDLLKFDDGSKPHPLNEADVLRVMQGIAYSKSGLNEEAEKAFESVNKRLRDAVEEGNKRTLSAYKFEADAKHNIGQEELRAEQIAAARAGRAAAAGQQKAVNWQLERLQKGEKLGQEASGYAEGLAAARAAGPSGKAAEGIYGQHLAGVHQQMRGLGLSVPEPKTPEMKSLGDGLIQMNGEVFMMAPPEKGKPPRLVKVGGAGPTALEQALAARLAGGAPAESRDSPAAPRAPTPANRVYGAPGEREQAMMDALARQQGPLGMSMPLTPANPRMELWGR